MSGHHEDTAKWIAAAKAGYKVEYIDEKYSPDWITCHSYSEGLFDDLLRRGKKIRAEGGHFTGKYTGKENET